MPNPWWYRIEFQGIWDQFPRKNDSGHISYVTYVIDVKIAVTCRANIRYSQGGESDVTLSTFSMCQSILLKNLTEFIQRKISNFEKCNDSVAFALWFACIREICVHFYDFWYLWNSVGKSKIFKHFRKPPCQGQSQCLHHFVNKFSS